MNNLCDAMQVLKDIQEDVNQKRVAVQSVNIGGCSSRKRESVFIDPYGDGNVSRLVYDKTTKISIVVSEL